jgi:hypothetical protein
MKVIIFWNQQWNPKRKKITMNCLLKSIDWLAQNKKSTNMKRIILTFVAVLSMNTLVNASDLIRLIDPLDEPEFYCLDLSGWGDHLKLDDPLQAHTCKVRNPADQLFTLEGNRITVGDTDRCIQVSISSGKPLAGSAILARTCDTNNTMQTFTLEENGHIRIADSNLCIGAGMDSTEASGPSHMWRVLSAMRCDGDPAYITWQIGLK